MEVKYSDDRSELFAALSKAQAKITGAVKDSTNPFFKSKYADLATCLDAIREPLAENDLCIIQTTDNDGGSVTVITTLGHSSGQWMTGELTMTPEKPGPQAFGICITYARRYAVAAIVGLAQIDDDAESATNRDKPAGPNVQKVWADAKTESGKGLSALEAWFKAQPKPVKAILAGDGAKWDKMKGFAADVDAANETDEQ